MITTFTQNWNLMRLFRLILGAFIIYDGFRSREYAFIGAGVLLIGMSLFNIGCCGVQGCNVPTKSNNNDLEEKEVVFEEVK